MNDYAEREAGEEAGDEEEGADDYCIPDIEELEAIDMMQQQHPLGFGPADGDSYLDDDDDDVEGEESDYGGGGGVAGEEEEEEGEDEYMGEWVDEDYGCFGEQHHQQHDDDDDDVSELPTFHPVSFPRRD